MKELKEEQDMVLRIKLPKECPKCGSTNIVSVPQSTNLEPIPEITWMCSDCLYEGKFCEVDL